MSNLKFVLEAAGTAVLIVGALFALYAKIGTAVRRKP